MYVNIRLSCYGLGMDDGDHSASAGEARLDRQMRKGLLGLAALGALAREPMHGYALAQALKAVTGASVAEGTLYPLLAGYEADGWVATDWDTSRPGPARKVYTVTDDGRMALARLAARFTALTSAVQESLP
jgi:PadR family transcriptional regulator PadR